MSYHVEAKAKAKRLAELNAAKEHPILHPGRRRRLVLAVVVVVLSAVTATCVVQVAKKASTPVPDAESLHARAVSYRDRRDATRTARYAKLSLFQDRDNVDVRWLLGTALNDVGDGEGAEKEIRLARKMGLEDPSLAWELLESSMLQRHYSVVLVETGGAALDQKDIALLLLRAEAQMGLAEYDKGREIFSRALELNPDYVAALLGMVRISLARSELETASRYLERARQVDAGWLETRLLVGRLALARGDYEQARRAIGEAFNVLVEREVMPEISLGMAQSFLAENRPDAAMEHLTDLENITGPVAEWRYLSGVAALQRGDLTGAKWILVKLLQDSPNHLDGLFLSAWSHYTRLEFNQAEFVLNRLLRISDDNKDALLLLAVVQLGLGDPHIALETLRLVEPQSPGDWQLIGLLARAHEQADHVDEPEVYRQKLTEGLAAENSAWEPHMTEHLWAFRRCGALIHFCRQCLYVRQCH